MLWYIYSFLLIIHEYFFPLYHKLWLVFFIKLYNSEKFTVKIHDFFSTCFLLSYTEPLRSISHLPDLLRQIQPPAVLLFLTSRHFRLPLDLLEGKSKRFQLSKTQNWRYKVTCLLPTPFLPSSSPQKLSFLPIFCCLHEK